MAKPVLQWDPELAGFGVRANKNGTVNYIAKISINDRDRWYTIGPVDLIKRDDARKLVQRMKLIARAGEDPSPLLKDFQKAEGTTAGSITFEEYLSIYIDRYAKVYKSSWLKDEQRINYYLMEKWKNKRLSEITRHDFAEIFEKLAKKKPFAANRLKETLSTMHNQAMILGYLPLGSTSWTFGVKKIQEFPREDRLEREQVQALMKVLLEYPAKDRIYADAIIFIMLTGLRHGETIRLEWSWFNFKSRKFTIPRKKTKNRKGHSLPLNDAMILLLDRQPKYSSNKYVFPSRLVPGEHISSLQRHWEIIRQKAGVPELHIHDLRRSVGSFILEISNSLQMVGNVLNQSSQHISARYAFYKTEQMRPVIDAHGEFIQSQEPIQDQEA